jgi:hypothetical protein
LRERYEEAPGRVNVTASFWGGHAAAARPKEGTGLAESPAEGPENRKRRPRRRRDGEDDEIDGSRRRTARESTSRAAFRDAVEGRRSGAYAPPRMARKRQPDDSDDSPAAFLARSIPERRRSAVAAEVPPEVVPSNRRRRSRDEPRTAASPDDGGNAFPKLRPPKRPKLDVRRARTYPLGGRPSKVATTAFGAALEPGLRFADWLERLPDILAAADLRFAARTIAETRLAGRGVALGMGAHAIKVGLTPLLVDLMERGVLTSLALNGAGIIHDFELAAAGKTSEDVGPGLDRGAFGMARETGATLNRVIREAARDGLGLGEAIGKHIEARRYPHRRLSVLAAGARLGIPVTVHVAVGTDIIHMHPSADGAAIGETSLRDFRRLAEVVAGLAGGVYINLGSAVVLPEVFVKALNLARNLGHPVRPLYTIDLDFLRHYRPGVNVVSRPTASGGRGVHITGHHELLFPLLAGAVLEQLALGGRKAKRGK